MKFKLKTSQNLYSCIGEPPSYEMKALEELGFSFECADDKEFFTDSEYFIKGKPTIELNTINELLEFIKKYGEVVVNSERIEIYNYYRE